MAQKTLNAYVVLSGKVDNTVGQLGVAIQNIGSQVNEVSEKLINFGKKSLEVYKNYDDSMRDAKGALSTKYGEESQALKRVMSDLDEAAQQWAATSIFHTNDIANGIALVSHAGWDFEQIMDGIPAAMKLAQAGGLDLSQAIDYIVTSTQAAGIGFDELSEWTDVWAFAANSSAGDIQQFGEAIARMGATAQFAKSKEELVTLLAVLHNTGAKGQEAGTLLRNTMLRLVAPTSKASKVMADLEISATEMDAAVGESAGDLNAAMEALEAAGFSAYDEQGNLKGFVDIFKDLNKALVGMDEQAKNNVLASIFPTRTMTGALAFLNAAGGEFDHLLGALEAGDAVGYGEYLSELMMGGITGSNEILQSKIEALELLIGQRLAPDIKEINTFLGGLIDKISGMDDTSFSAIVAGLESIAGLGPGLLILGAGLKLFGALMSPAGAIALGLTTVTTLVAVLQDLKESQYEGQFGEMALDTGELSSFVKTLGDDFNKAWANVSGFRSALDGSVKSYQKASTEFSSGLLTNVIEGTKLSPDDKKQLEQLGIDMYTETLQAIQDSGNMASQFWEMMAGGDSVAEFDPKYQKIIDLLKQNEGEMVAKAGTINNNLHDALMRGFQEGFTEEDYQEILGYMNEYNNLIARAQAEAANQEQFVQQEKMLRKAQTASIEDVQSMAATAAASRDANLDELESTYLAEIYRLNQMGVTAENDPDGLLAAAEGWYRAQESKARSGYDEFMMRLWRSSALGSDLGEQYDSLETLAGMYMSGRMGKDEAMKQWTGDRGSMMRLVRNMVESYGSIDTVAELAGGYAQSGNMDLAEKMRALVGMYNMLSDGGPNGIMQPKINEAVELAQSFTIEGEEEAARKANDAAQAILNHKPLVQTIIMQARLEGKNWGGLGGSGGGAGLGVESLENVTMNARGGRQTEPSIFAEAGIPEWYIPEEHSANTARLLLGAMYNSGFSIFDLAAAAGARMFAEGGTSGSGSLSWGSLSSGSGSGDGGSAVNSISVQYSPVIHADNAAGVGDMLKKDKERMQKWFEEWWERKNLYESMTVYT